MMADTLDLLLDRALAARADYLDGAHDTAFRLFNGFLEGFPDLAVDLYGRTLVFFYHGDDRQAAPALVEKALALLLEKLPWVQSAVLKMRGMPGEDSTAQSRRGIMIYGETLARKIRENGVWYAVDLTMNADASLFLDTRGLRAWAMEGQGDERRLAGRRVLNTFAYTGSLGVAALAGGAREVVQMDLNRRFLNLAKDSYALNGYPVRREDFRAGDFWTQVNQLKRAGALFDCVFVDPPFFSATARGRVDLLTESHRVINKVRPLVAHNGWLVTINNALFLSGKEYLGMLEGLCADGYLSIETLIPVPPDFTGFPGTRVGQPPVDPTPFNHSTKIAVLRVTRKDQKTA